MFRLKTILISAVFATVYSIPSYAINLGQLVDSATKALASEEKGSATVSEHTISNPDDVRIAIGFSPEGSAQTAIIEMIDSSKSQIRLAAYSFTSPAIVKALIRAKKRGIDVRIVVDEKGNKSKSSVAAMNLITNTGIPLRTISKYAIHHDKYIVSDSKNVETGSFNYSSSANDRNSENAIVLYNMPQVASQYLAHWESRWSNATAWHSSY